MENLFALVGELQHGARPGLTMLQAVPRAGNKVLIRTWLLVTFDMTMAVRETAAGHSVERR